MFDKLCFIGVLGIIQNENEAEETTYDFLYPVRKCLIKILKEINQRFVIINAYTRKIDGQEAYMEAYRSMITHEGDEVGYAIRHRI